MKRVWTLWILVIAALLAAGWVGVQAFTSSDSPVTERSVRLKMQLDGARKNIDLQQSESGEFAFHVQRYDGTSQTLTPHQFAQMLYEQEVRGTFFSRLFNISSPLGMIWIAVGLIGQLLFTGRMIVQWLASEKHRRSVVPTVFWWMSLIGAGMLLSYFLWRRDIVGVLGQTVGLVIYVRNLHLIHAARRAATLQPVSIGETAPV